MTYWWLVENFTPEGQSTGLYMACQVNMTLTADVHKARKFRLQRTAEFRALDMREARRGDWRAVEHGFDDSKTPNKPLRRGVDGVCTRSTCECEREGLGDQCVWLRPVETEFECLGEPSLCTNPRGCACVPDSMTPNAVLTGAAHQ